MARYGVVPFEAEGGTAYRLLDTERRAEAVLYPAFGNNCTEFRTTPDPKSNDSGKTLSEPVDLFVPPKRVSELRLFPFSTGQPILFPFPNRVREGRYTFEGREGRFDESRQVGWDRATGHAIHGLVAEKAWTVEAAQAEGDGACVRARLQLDAFPDIFAQYPYACRITVTYRLWEGVLEMHTEVWNTGETTLPMGFGIHPYFPVALRPGVRLPEGLATISPEQRARAAVKVPAEARWELEGFLPTGTVLPVATDPADCDLRAFQPLGDRTFDDFFTCLCRRADGWSEGGVRDPQSGLEMYLAADPGFREWVFYAPPGRPFVALEPYTCATDAINLEPQGIDAGLIVLAAGQAWKGEIRFGLRYAG